MSVKDDTRATPEPVAPPSVFDLSWLFRGVLR
jgi:hypothetical protein